MAKQTGQAAGVHEDGPLTGRDVAVGYEFDQAREGACGVGRVKEEALGPRGEDHRPSRGGCERGVSVPDLVPTDLQVVQLSGRRGHATDDVAHDRRDIGDGAWGWPSTDGLCLGGLAHGTGGIALALARLAGAASREDFVGAARAAYRHESVLFDAATANWPALVKDGAGVRRLDMKTWCHGAPGIALSRLAARGLGDPALGRELEIALDATRRTGLLSLDHVCCGNAGLVDTHFTAGEALARPDLASAAQARLGAVLRRARLFGGYRLRGGEEENAGVLPGFFRGHAGIGYMLLRLARPGHFPNVLAFEARGPSGHTMGAA